ncbi:serine acetyltransferase [Bacteroides clarus]|uniref:serine acetyltransferase n=1 Tax=Bacteroides clarus TaxID=626929 RepID=UPI00248EB42A|nr:serine acetyltransferase [Bacteroides clarus]
MAVKELFTFILSDYQRYKGVMGGVKNIVTYLLFGFDHRFNYCFWLRLASQKNLLFPLAIWMHRRLSKKYGIQIPRRCKIGYGFYIGHGIGIVINGGTVIGNNVNISQFLTIGSNKGTPAVIGDNVYIGPNVCIVEDVHIGNNATIGAGSVCTRRSYRCRRSGESDFVQGTGKIYKRPLRC